METKINIAEILKDKPKGTKLYSYICAGECILNEVSENAIYVDMYNKERFWYFSVYGTVYAFQNGGVLLYPSYEMRDWSKFAWKKGDVLAGNNGTRKVLFHSWVNDSYTKFVGLHCMIAEDVEGFVYDEGTTVFNTNDFKRIEDEYAVQCYINTIEKKLGGKLNRETLEIEPAQSEFKDGDIVTATSDFGSIFIGILKKSIKDFPNEELRFYCALENLEQLAFGGSEMMLKAIKTSFATEEEKQQLFDALLKEGKAWDAEKKEVVDLKPKVEFKPFDRVIARNAADDVWTANIFSHMDSHGEYVTIACVGGYTYCLPYNEETAKLIGTTNNWEG